MTSATINAAAVSPLPTWLVVVLCVVIFVAVSVVTGYVTYKYRIKSSKGVQEDDDTESDK
ncbi:MAG: hypothetical protein Q4A05_02460 [Ruminococcus sp.]|nr:hypothetical protein [Ruminococcus sp.]